jgi:hypothetical protein
MPSWDRNLLLEAVAGTAQSLSRIQQHVI